jgi:hypothetical protein
MQPGDLDWIVACLEQHGGAMSLPALERELLGVDPGGLEALRTRLAVAPQLTRLADGQVALLRDRVQGANFRLAPAPWEHAQGVLRLDGTEVAAALASQGQRQGPDRDVSWRGLDEPPAGPHRTRLARGGPDGQALLLTGLEGWYAGVGFQHGDDVIVHIRDLATPLLVLDHVPRLDRDEGVLRRRTARVVDAACAVLEETDGWLALEHLQARVLGHVDYSRASICSVTFMEPSSAAMAEPTRPAITTETRIGVSSRASATATTPPMALVAPYLMNSLAICSVKTMPTESEINRAIGRLSTPMKESWVMVLRPCSWPVSSCRKVRPANRTRLPQPSSAVVVPSPTRSRTPLTLKPPAFPALHCSRPASRVNRTP